MAQGPLVEISNLKLCCRVEVCGKTGILVKPVFFNTADPTTVLLGSTSISVIFVTKLFTEITEITHISNSVRKVSILFSGHKQQWKISQTLNSIICINIFENFM